MKHPIGFVPLAGILLAAGLTLAAARSDAQTAAPHRATTRAPGKPGLKQRGQVRGFSLQDYRAHNARYVTNEGVKLLRVTPRVYDAWTRTLRTHPQLKRLAKRWYTAQLVYYDPERGAAGLWVQTRSDVAPSLTHHHCGARYERIPGSPLRLCRRCQEVVRYRYQRPKNLQRFYVHLNLKTKRILWKVRMKHHDLYPLGVDRAGRYFMAYRKQFRKSGGRSTQTVGLVRVNLRRRKVDWAYSVTFPERHLRYKGKAMLYASADLRRVLIREYDERGTSRPNGYLSSPRARGVIVDVASSSHVTIPVPVSSYGAIFGRQNRILYLTSHQLGRIYKLDARTGQLLKTVYNGYGAFGLHFSRTERYLYCLHFSGVTVYDPVTLKRVKTISLRRLFPGHRKLLMVPGYVSLRSGDLLYEMLAPPKRGIGSVTKSSGFVHFKALE